MVAFDSPARYQRRISSTGGPLPNRCALLLILDSFAPRGATVRTPSRRPRSRWSISQDIRDKFGPVGPGVTGFESLVLSRGVPDWGL